MKRIRPLHLLAVLGFVALSAPDARASRCSDDPERCVKSTATLSRTVGHVVVKDRTTPVTPALLVAPAPAPPTAAARKAVAPARKPAAKTPRVTPRATPTPGMGMLLKLSNGSGGEISWLPGRNGENSGRGWVL